MNGRFDDDVCARFEIREQIARGGFGAVHVGLDRQTGARVAVKKLRTPVREAAAIERFAREAALLARIASPHVVAHLADGRTPEGELWLVLEWIAGLDLSRQQQAERLGLADALDVARQAALGLAALHREGVVHRDVKPANFVLRRRAGAGFDVKLIDLGIALDSRRPALTEVGLRIGTPAYMSPEQVRAEGEITPASDVYSLGVMLYEMLAGRRPFQGASHEEVFARILLQQPPDLAALAPGVGPALAALVLGTLDKSPARRSTNAAEFARALESLPAHDRPRPATAPVPPATHEASIDALSAESSEASTVALPDATVALRPRERLVTVLFAAAADPAAAAREFAVIARVLSGHGARVFRTPGAQTLGIFGETRTEGDEPRRAALAALALSREVPGLTLVIVTGRAREGSLALGGELIERALSAAARAGGSVALDTTTARLLESSFSVVPLRGAGGAFSLAGERPEAGLSTRGTLLGRPTPTVGRDREFALLDEALAACVRASEPRGALVVADAGAGKSRVARGWLARSAGGVRVLSSRGDPIARDTPLRVVSRLVAAAAGLRDAPDGASARALLEARVAEALPAGRAAVVAGFLGEIGGLPDDPGGRGAPPEVLAARRDSAVMAEKTLDAWAEWLGAEARRRPVVLCVDDAHWCDAPSARFLEAALRRCAGAPVFVLALARPSPALPLADLDTVTRVDLSPLSDEACASLARAVLGPGFDPAAVARAVRRAEGNAFFFEELLRAEGEGRGEHVPETVLLLVEARLERLDPVAQTVLCSASTFGPAFWDEGVRALCVPGLEPGAVDPALASLCAMEWVERRRATHGPLGTEYAFRHALQRDGAYGTLGESARRALHLRAGDWLAAAGANEPGVLATHFSLGGARARAAGYYVLAAERALSGNDPGGAVMLAENAVSHGAEGETLGRARHVEAEALLWRAQNTRARAAVAEALLWLRPGCARWYEALGTALRAANALGAWTWLDDLIAVLTETEPDADAGMARDRTLARVAGTLMVVGRQEDGARMLERVQTAPEAVESSDPLLAARVYTALSYRAENEGRLDEAVRLAERSVATYERGGIARERVHRMVSRGALHVACGDLAGGERHLRRALEDALAAGITSGAAAAQHNLGHCLGRMGRADEGLEVELLALETYRALRNPRMEGHAREYAAELYRLRGDFATAEQCAREACDQLRALPAGEAACAHAQHALALMELGRADEAVAAARRGVENMPSGTALASYLAEPAVRHALSAALSAAGLRDEAREAMDHARQALSQRAARIADDAMREQYTRGVWEHARIVATS